MQITVITSLETRAQSDVLVFPFWKEEARALAACPLAPYDHLISGPVRTKDLSGKAEEVVWLYSEMPQEKRLVLLGLGAREKLTRESLRRSVGALAGSCRDKKIRSMTFVLPKSDLLEERDIASAIAEALFSKNYSFDTFLDDSTKKEKHTHLESVQIVAENFASVRDALDRTAKIAEGVALARDLVNGNANDVTPEYLGAVAKKLSKQFPRITTHVHDKKWAEKEGMGLFLAVAQGSSVEPKFIICEYRGDPTSSDHTVIVGKGVTFDTGGINLKPTGFVETQKGDMAGAATALGTIHAVAALNMAVNVTAVIAATDNAIGPNSSKPGDVYRAISGKTVEITNTDAEGRLTLADALYWTTQNLKPTRMIDIATLTGAMVVALGHQYAGVMATAEPLADELIRAGEHTGEKLWQFPLDDEYKEDLKSDIADIKNAGPREGGAILGALFLREFVGNVPWAHIDMAGTAFLKDAKKYLPKHGIGFGVRMFVEFLEKLEKSA